MPARLAQVEAPAQSRAALWLEALVVISLGLAIAIPLRGHFQKPHADFIGFHDAADALAASRLDTPHKRAPVYPALLAAWGGVLRMPRVSEPPPRIVFAEWLNALLLPVNAVLVLLVGRHWLRALNLPEHAGRWISITFLIVPVGISMTAHLLVEPLLTALILATVLAAGHRLCRTAYVLAALASLTRYDAAGLLAGLVIADLLAERRRNAMIRGLLGSFPLLAWLGLTALYWEREVGDHYLKQIYERPQFEPLQSARVIFDAAFAMSRVHLPAWLDVDESLVRRSLRWMIAACVMIGMWRLIRSRERSVVVAAACGIGYWLVHAVFPFSYERFGYPLTPLLLLATGIGMVAIVAALQPTSAASATTARTLRNLRCFAYVAGALFATMLLLGSIDTQIAALRLAGMTWFGYLFTCGLVGSIAAAAIPPWRAWPANVAALLGIMLWLIPGQLREACGFLGTGEDRANLVTAAKWLAANCPRDSLVLTDLGGFVRIYGEAANPGTLGYFEINADGWPEIIAELKSRGVRYITWHDDVFAEFADAFYASRWRLDRFTQLGGDDIPIDLELITELPGDPPVRIFAIR